jgi:uncharacterized UPF0160 family protein
MSIEAMKQAVATIDKIIDGCNNVQEEKDIHGDAKTLAKLIKKDCFPTLEALCQAIAKAEKQEPVGYVSESGKGAYLLVGVGLEDDTPLYAAPLKREWVGLTDEEVHDAFNFVEFVKQVSFDRDRPEWCENFAAYLEAKLKEKNR